MAQEAATPTPSPLIIRDAFYGNMACRGALYNVATFDGYIPVSFGIDTSRLNDIVGRNPLPGQVKVLSMLFIYPELGPAKLFNVSETTGGVNLTSTSTSNVSKLPDIKGADQALEILALVYGNAVITDQLIYDSAYARFRAGKGFLVNNDSMGGDPMPGVQKTAVLYWKAYGVVKSQSVIEGGILRTT